MVLSDTDIKRYIQQGKIRISPELPSDQFGSCSVDFRLGSEFNVFEHSRYPYIDLKSKAALEGIMRSVNVEPGEPFILQPREFVLAITRRDAGTGCGRSRPAGGAIKPGAYRDHRAWHRRSL